MSEDKPKGKKRALKSVKPSSEVDNIVRLPERGVDSIGRKKALPGSASGVVEVQTWNEMDADGEYTGRTELRERRAPPPERRCKAIIGNLEWAGNQCTRWTILGGSVCPTHGGSLPEVKKKAQQRLAMAADMATQKLIHIAITKRGVQDRDRIKAITEILDRAGIQGKQTIELEIKPWQQMLQRLQGKTEEGSTIEAKEGIDFYVLDELPPDEDDEDGE